MDDLTAVCNHLRLGVVLLWVVIAAVLPIIANEQPPSVAPTDNSFPGSPKFVALPDTSVTFANTKGVILPCKVHSDPQYRSNRTVYWQSANGSRVVDEPGLVKFHSANGSLQFLPFSERLFSSRLHLTRFRCVVEFAAFGAIVSPWIQLRAVAMEQYESYEVRVNDVWVTRGNTAVLRCVVNPPFLQDHLEIIGWLRGNNRLPVVGDSQGTEESRQLSLKSSDSSHEALLLIRDVIAEDSFSVYNCLVRNKLTGSERLSVGGYIHITELVNSEPKLVEPNSERSEIKVWAGSNAQLPCVADGYPQPLYVWSKNSQPISADGNSRIRRFAGSLLIQNASPDDSGQYTCVASNRLGVRVATIRLQVLQQLAADIRPVVQQVDAGHMAELQCRIHGSPVRSVSWLHNGRLLNSSSLAASWLISGDMNETLLVRHVDRPTVGFYQCLVGNERQTVVATASLLLGAARPMLETVPSSREVADGSYFSLRCVATGSPTPIITWSLDDEPLIIPITSSNRLSLLPGQLNIVSNGSIADGKAQSELHVRQANKFSSGRFRCTASNSVGSDNHTTLIRISGSPFIRPMSNVTTIAGRPAVLRCHAVGSVTRVTWHRGEIELPDNMRQTLDSESGALTINPIKSSDASEYTCGAYDAQGRGITRSLHLSVVHAPVIDAFSLAPKVVGDRVSIMCVVSSGDMPVQIWWLHNGQPLNVTRLKFHEQTTTFSSSLSMAVGKEHEGNYTCVARNIAAEVNHTAMLKVNVPAVFSEMPHDTEVLLGLDVTLRCAAVGDPKPQISWQFSPSARARRYRPVSTSNEDGSLVLNNVTAADEGEYMCHATNGIGSSVTKIVSLFVNVPVYFSNTSAVNNNGTVKENRTTKLGQPTKLLCEAFGDKPITFRWTHNNQPTSAQTTTRQLDSDNAVSELDLSVAKRSTAGIYACQAKNDFGQRFLEINLTVIEKPESPQQLQVRSFTSRTVALNWRAGFDGNSPIINYLVEYKLAEKAWKKQQFRNVTTLTAATFTVLHSLHPAQVYDIRVFAINEVGTSLPSETARVRLEEETPNGIPTTIRAKNVSSTSVRVSWSSPPSDQMNGVLLGYYVGYRQLDRGETANSSSNQSASTTTVPADHFTYVPVAPEINSLTIPNLAMFSRYALIVQAYNAKGNGPKSTEVIVTTAEDRPSAPPSGVNAKASSPQRILVAWKSPPLQKLNGILRGYVIYYKPELAFGDRDPLSIRAKEQFVQLEDLEPFTNYSIEVVAYTDAGEGVHSKPIFIRTFEDVPVAPAPPKVVQYNSTHAALLWMAPARPNGVLTGYTVAWSANGISEEIKVSGYEQTGQLLVPARIPSIHDFRVAAETNVGRGPFSELVHFRPVNEVKANILGFSRVIYAHWQETVMFDCPYVGEAPVELSWWHLDKKLAKLNSSSPLRAGVRSKIFSNGSLKIDHVQTIDAANYTCLVENRYGSDRISISLNVIVVPESPSIHVSAENKTAIRVQWTAASDGGSPFTGFSLLFRSVPNSQTESTVSSPIRHDQPANDWQKLILGRERREAQLTNLGCGTNYEVKLAAKNRLGDGHYSEVVIVRTLGTAPIEPDHSQIKHYVGITNITLNLHSWALASGGRWLAPPRPPSVYAVPTNGSRSRNANTAEWWSWGDVCPIQSFDIRYRAMGTKEWMSIEKILLDPTKSLRTIRGLDPATFYILRVRANSEAGFTEAELRFMTRKFDGTLSDAAIPTDGEVLVTNSQRSDGSGSRAFYDRPEVFVPLFALLSVLILLVIGLIMYFWRRQSRTQLLNKALASQKAGSNSSETSLTFAAFSSCDMASKHTNLTSVDVKYAPQPPAVSEPPPFFGIQSPLHDLMQFHTPPSMRSPDKPPRRRPPGPLPQNGALSNSIVGPTNEATMSSWTFIPSPRSDPKIALYQSQTAAGFARSKSNVDQDVARHRGNDEDPSYGTYQSLDDYSESAISPVGGRIPNARSVDDWLLNKRKFESVNQESKKSPPPLPDRPSELRPVMECDELDAVTGSFNGSNTGEVSRPDKLLGQSSLRTRRHRSSTGSRKNVRGSLRSRLDSEILLNPTLCALLASQEGISSQLRQLLLNASVSSKTAPIDAPSTIENEVGSERVDSCSNASSRPGSQCGSWNVKRLHSKQGSQKSRASNQTNQSSDYDELFAAYEHHRNNDGTLDRSLDRSNLVGSERHNDLRSVIDPEQSLGYDSRESYYREQFASPSQYPLLGATGLPAFLDNASLRTNSSMADSGIRQFTQSPPDPEQLVEAACELPLYGTSSSPPSTSNDAPVSPSSSESLESGPTSNSFDYDEDCRLSMTATTSVGSFQLQHPLPLPPSSNPSAHPVSESDSHSNYGTTPRRLKARHRSRSRQSRSKDSLSGGQVPSASGSSSDVNETHVVPEVSLIKSSSSGDWTPRAEGPPHSSAFAAGADPSLDPVHPLRRLALGGFPANVPTSTPAIVSATGLNSNDPLSLPSVCKFTVV